MFGSVACIVVVLLCAQAHGIETRDSHAVRIRQGPLRGFKASDGDYFVFYNIPYATAPTGRDRYKAPLPGPAWLTERLALDEGIICPQDPAGGIVNKTKQENCLVANVYVPDTDEENLPVVVYIHGGAFQMGYGEMAVPKTIVKSKKVIAVTFNYRLGMHGFLCLGTKDAPGNAGLKDQVALLRWVKNNIAEFGGDPDDVTIDGFSAGSASVDLHALSDMTKGLFHKAILQSGASIAPWAVQFDPIKIARTYAEEKFEFDGGDDIYALENFYKDLTYEDMIKNSILNDERQHFFFVPCIERDTGVERFLTKSPFEIFKKGEYSKVPMLYGFDNMEGLFRKDEFSTWSDKMNDNFADFLPVDLQFKDEEKKTEVADKVKEFYFGDNEVDDESITSYVDYYTDVIFVFPILRAVRLQVEAGNDNVYLYMYSFAEEAIARLSGITDPRLVGASHCAQTEMVLDSNTLVIPQELLTDDFKAIKSAMTEVWINFITKGEPVPDESSLPEWPAADADGSPHMSINRTLVLHGRPLEKRAKFWLDIYDKYYHIPIAPAAPSAKRAEL